MAPITLSVSDIIAKARQSELYLGDPNLPKLVAYAPGTYGNVLVLKSTLDEDVPTPATVTFFGEVSRSGCFVSPYGAYSPRKFEKQTIDKAKIRMQIRNITQPKHRKLIPEWKEYLANLNSIHRLNYSGGAIPTISTPIKDQEITICHDLFEKIAKKKTEPKGTPTQTQKVVTPDGDASDANDDEEAVVDLTLPSQGSEATDNDGDKSDTGLSPSPYSIEGWPVSGDWRDEMLANKDDLRLMPLVLYDGVHDEAEPIGPSDYESRLPGSVVKVVATFHSYKFSSHALAIHIEEICIISPPSTLAVSPKKRRFNDLVGQGSPTKKGKSA